MLSMNKKILIISSDYNQFFFKPILYKLKKKINNLHVCLIEENKYKKLKRFFYLSLTLNIFELLESLFSQLKFNLNNKIEYSYSNFPNINSKEFIKYLKKNRFDLIVLFNCPQILTKRTLDKIKSNIVNFHPGLLTHHRGLFPIFYALLNKEKFIGLSFHIVEKKIDSGKIINEIKLPIRNNEGYLSLYKKLYLSNKVFNFMERSILNYKTNRKDYLKKKITTKYYSYPKIADIIKFKIIKLFDL